MNKDVQISRLCIYTDLPFLGSGGDFRKALTAQFKDIQILHNHVGDGFDYTSPKVRYIVTEHIPKIVSFSEAGLEILEKIYSSGLEYIKREHVYKVTGVELKNKVVKFGLDEALHMYRSLTPWISLNKKNYEQFQMAGSHENRKKILESILTGNYLSLCKTLGIHVSERILTSVLEYEIVDISHLDNNGLFGFNVSFVSNMLIDDWIGIGKLVSKGFGVMEKTG